MYNKKCKTTFLFLMALLCLITLILPFMQVGFWGDVSVFLKIIYYFSISIFVISIVLIILIGVFSLFKNNYILLSIQEILAYLAFIMLFVNLLIFIANKSAILTVGFSILCLESFIMACFDDILKLIKKLPRTFKNISSTLSEQRQLKLQQQASIVKTEIENNVEENVVEIDLNKEISEEEVKIIPPDEDLI